MSEPIDTSTKATQMICLACDRIENANCTAPAFPDKPIPWGWNWAIGGAYCERCSVRVPTSARPGSDE